MSSQKGKKPSKAAESSGEAVAKTPWTKLRENVEAVFIAIILALIIRHFSLEAFEIPTGSMAPGLHGVHVLSHCPNCDTEAPVGVQTDSQTGKVQGHLFAPGWIYSGPCPECQATIEDVPEVNVEQDIPAGHQVYCPVCRAHVAGQPQGYRRSSGFKMFEGWCPECTLVHREVFEPSDCLGGHKILVNKFLYQVSEPERWQVIVFKFNRQRNYIKRLVGLPGERIQVVDGDIYINDALERKPEWAQDELWQRVHDSTVPERRWVNDNPWREEKGKGWQQDEETGAFTFNTLVGFSQLRYRRPVRNIYAYNSAKNRRGDPVRDLRLESSVTLTGGEGYLELQVHNGEQTYACRLPCGGEGSASFLLRTPETEEDGLVLLPQEGSLDGIRLEVGRETLVDFYVADRWLVLRIDGSVAAATPLTGDHQRPYSRSMKTSVGFECRGVGLRLSRTRVFRDIHYTWLNHRDERFACEAPYQLPFEAQPVIEPNGVIVKEGYFAMGDNSPSSLDSRAWGYVPAQNMLGRAFAVFWPALPWRFEVGFIR